MAAAESTSDGKVKAGKLLRDLKRGRQLKSIDIAAHAEPAAAHLARNHATRGIASEARWSTVRAVVDADVKLAAADGNRLRSVFSACISEWGVFVGKQAQAAMQWAATHCLKGTSSPVAETSSPVVEMGGSALLGILWMLRLDPKKTFPSDSAMLKEMGGKDGALKILMDSEHPKIVEYQQRAPPTDAMKRFVLRQLTGPDDGGGGGGSGGAADIRRSGGAADIRGAAALTDSSGDAGAAHRSVPAPPPPLLKPLPPNPPAILAVGAFPALNPMAAAAAAATVDANTGGGDRSNWKLRQWAATCFILTFFLNSTYRDFQDQGRAAYAATGPANNLVFLVKVHLKHEPALQRRVVRMLNAAHYLSWMDLGGFYSWTELVERGLLSKGEVAELQTARCKKNSLVLLWILEELAGSADTDERLRRHHQCLFDNPVFLKMQEQVLACRGQFNALATARSVQVPIVYTHMLWWFLIVFLLILGAYAGYVLVLTAFLALFDVAMALREPFGLDATDIDP
ncbi:hypothetical protein JKP88DRAFT_330705 [Tribonema minus]|uniref:Uncharacterized protein n=1 Tax=Tribonema minus TaxID=303371 RepID=A0A835YR03_9STRA|nr:hypothetical protein JKP88DRAFT_330705 [Tribonema minus]